MDPCSSNPHCSRVNSKASFTTLQQHSCLLHSAPSQSPSQGGLSFLNLDSDPAWGLHGSMISLPSYMLTSLAQQTSILQPERQLPIPRIQSPHPDLEVSADSESQSFITICPGFVHLNVLPSLSSYKCLAPNKSLFLHCLFTTGFTIFIQLRKFLSSLLVNWTQCHLDPESTTSLISIRNEASRRWEWGEKATTTKISHLYLTYSVLGLPCSDCPASLNTCLRVRIFHTWWISHRSWTQNLRCYLTSRHQTREHECIGWSIWGGIRFFNRERSLAWQMPGSHMVRDKPWLWHVTRESILLHLPRDPRC